MRLYLCLFCFLAAVVVVDALCRHPSLACAEHFRVKDRRKDRGKDPSQGACHEEQIQLLCEEEGNHHAGDQLDHTAKDGGNGASESLEAAAPDAEHDHAGEEDHLREKIELGVTDDGIRVFCRSEEEHVDVLSEEDRKEGDDRTEREVEQ